MKHLAQRATSCLYQRAGQDWVFLKYEFQSNIVCGKPVAHQKWGKCQKQTLLGHNSEATTHAVDLPPSYQTTPVHPAQRWMKKVQLSDFHLAQLPPLSLCPGQLKTSLTRKNTGKAFIGKNDHPVLVTWYSDLVACVARVAWVELEILSEWHFYESHIG